MNIDSKGIDNAVFLKLPVYIVSGFVLGVVAVYMMNGFYYATTKSYFLTYSTRMMFSGTVIQCATACWAIIELKKVNEQTKRAIWFVFLVTILLQFSFYYLAFNIT